MTLLELAGFISRIEHKMFCRITEKELYDLNWKKKTNQRLCRHILRLIDRANNVSFWVATRILSVEGTTPEQTLGKRLVAIKNFIKLASVSTHYITKTWIDFQQRSFS
jgi:hypothetical protein